MATYAEELTFSSPDPLAVSMLRSSPGISLSPSKPTRPDLASPLRKAAATSVGFSLLDTPAALRTQPHSPIRTSLPIADNISPWRIHVTVEAERNENQKSPSPQKRATASPTRLLLADTRTTVVPLRGGDDDEPSPAPKRKRGRPRKNGTPARRQATPNPKRARTSTNTGKSLLESVETESQSMMLEDGENNDDSHVEAGAAQANTTTISSQTGSTQQAKPTNPKRFSDILEQHNGFDSIMEGEDFTMVSLSSLPSAKQLNALSSTKNDVDAGPNQEHANADSTGQRSLPTFGSPTRPAENNTFKRKHDLARLAELSAKAANASFRTPSAETQQLQQPDPPEPRVSSSPRALASTDRNRSSLSSVQKVAGVLNHAISHKSSSLLSSPAKLKASTSVSRPEISAANSGFGVGTQRELFAGLRMGEELAKQYPEISGQTPQNASNSIRKEGRSSVNRYKLPTPDGDTNSSLSESTSRHSLFAAASRTHLPSPQDSEREDSGNGPDLMDWQHDTLRQPSAAIRATTTGTITMRDVGDLSPPAAVTQSIRMTDAPNEADVDLWLGLDGTRDAPVDGIQLASPDIWQTEAQNSSMVSMSRENGVSKRSPVDVLPKPRRSKLPKTWRKTSGLIYSDEMTESSPIVQPTITALTFSADMAESSFEEAANPPIRAQEVTPLASHAHLPNTDYSVLSNLGMRGTTKKRAAKAFEPSMPSPKKRKVAEESTSKPVSLKAFAPKPALRPRDNLLTASPRRPFASKTPLFKPRARPAPLFASVTRTFSGKVTDLVGSLQNADLSSFSSPAAAKATSSPSWTETIADVVKPAFTFSMPFSFKSLPKPDLRALPSKLYTMVKPVSAQTSVQFYRGVSPPRSDEKDSSLSDHLPFTTSHYKHLSNLYKTAKSEKDGPSASSDDNEDVERLRGLWFEGNGWAKKLEDWELSVIPTFLKDLHGDENKSSTEKIDAEEVACRIMSLWAGEVQRGETKLGENEMAGLFEEKYAARRDAILAGTA